MVQLAKSTQAKCQSAAKISGRSPFTVRVSPETSKAKVILGRCAVFRPATAGFRFNPLGEVSLIYGFKQHGQLESAPPGQGPNQVRKEGLF